MVVRYFTQNNNIEKRKQLYTHEMEDESLEDLTRKRHFENP